MTGFRKKRKQEYNRARTRNKPKIYESQSPNNLHQDTLATSSDTDMMSQTAEIVLATNSEVSDLENSPLELMDTLAILVSEDCQDTWKKMTLSEYMEEDDTNRKSVISIQNQSLDEVPTSPLRIVEFSTVRGRTAQLISDLRETLEKGPTTTYESSTNNSYNSRSRSRSSSYERSRSSSSSSRSRFSSASSRASEIEQLFSDEQGPDFLTNEHRGQLFRTPESEIEPEPEKHSRNHSDNHDNPKNSSPPNSSENLSISQTMVTPQPIQPTPAPSLKPCLNNQDNQYEIQSIVTTCINSASANSGINLRASTDQTSDSTEYAQFELPVLSAVNAATCPLAPSCNCHNNTYCSFTGSSTRTSNWQRTHFNMNVDTLLSTVIPDELFRNIIREYINTHAHP